MTEHNDFIIIVEVSEAASGGLLEEKAIFKNFAIFTGKHLCWSFFLKKCRSTSGLQLY